MAISLPAEYHILPYSIPHEIPDFPEPAPSLVLAPEQLDCGEWFDAFVDAILEAKGRAFLPVCRMSDGEFLFALGHQRADVRRPLHERLAWEAGHALMTLGRMGRLRAGARRYYHSGDYSRLEWVEQKQRFAADVRWLSERGRLAIHLSYGAVRFQEYYFPALARWLQVAGIALKASNYVPFYFVYAAFSGPRARRLLSGRVLVVNGAGSAKREQIVRGLLRNGADKVEWCEISDRRALYDKVDVAHFCGNVDLALVGAGLAKAHVLRQLECLNVPCVDVGFMFEVWAEPGSAKDRPFCADGSENFS